MKERNKIIFSFFHGESKLSLDSNFIRKYCKIKKIIEKIDGYMLSSVGMDILGSATVLTRKTRCSVSIHSGSSALVIFFPRFLDKASHGIDSVI